MQTNKYNYPLSGVNVVDFGHYYAGPAVGMMLADQGANVVRVNQPNKMELPSFQYRLLNRNKKTVELDLKSREGLENALALIANADIVIENFRPGVMERLGLDYVSVKERNPGLIYLSLPGFASTDKERSSMQGWEGVVAAAAGIFTHTSKIREKLGFSPVYSWVPQCSMYAAYNGILGVTAALVAREDHGHGTMLEVPLAEAGVLGHILEIWNWNRRLDTPPEIPDTFKQFTYSPGDSASVQLKKLSEAHSRVWFSPLGSYYRCSDGRDIFIYNLYPNPLRYSQRIIRVLGIDQRLKSEGFVNTNAWEVDLPNNISASSAMGHEYACRLREIIADILMTKTAFEWERIFMEAKVAATVIRTREEWLQLEPMLSSGVLARMDDGMNMLTVPGRIVDVSSSDASVNGKNRIDESTEFREPKAITIRQAHHLFQHRNAVRKPLKEFSGQSKGDLLHGLRVMELTNMVAGPLAGIFLAEYGAEVIKVDTPDSPSPAAAARGEFLQHGKRSILIDVKTAPGRKVFEKLVSRTDVVIHNILDHTAMRLGADHEQLKKINPNIVSAQISAFGGSYRGYWELRPGFDNLMQAISGLMAQFGTLASPQDHGGIASSDIPGGLMLAFAALLGVYQRRRTGYAGECRTSLARVVSYYQLPYMIADKNGRSDWGEMRGQFSTGEKYCSRLYRCRNGWIYLNADKGSTEKITKLVDVSTAEGTALEAAFAVKDCEYWLDRLREKSISCHQALNLKDIYRKRVRYVENEEANESARDSTAILQWPDHPYGVPVTLLAPNYVRVGENQSWKRLRTAPRLGQHTVEVLQELGYSDGEIETLISIGVAHEYLAAFGSRDSYHFQSPAPIELGK